MLLFILWILIYLVFAPQISSCFECISLLEMWCASHSVLLTFQWVVCAWGLCNEFLLHDAALAWAKLAVRLWPFKRKSLVSVSKLQKRYQQRIPTAFKQIQSVVAAALPAVCVCVMESEILKFICANQGAFLTEELLCNLGDTATVSEIIRNEDKFACCCPFGQPKVVARTNLGLCRKPRDCPGSCGGLHVCQRFLISGFCPFSTSR